MAGRLPFSVELYGYFFTGKLYDKRGREIFELDRACEEAEELYGSDWSAVFNGEGGIHRDTWIGKQGGRIVR